MLIVLGALAISLISIMLREATSVFTDIAPNHQVCVTVILCPLWVKSSRSNYITRTAAFGCIPAAHG